MSVVAVSVVDLGQTIQVRVVNDDEGPGVFSTEVYQVEATYNDQASIAELVRKAAGVHLGTGTGEEAPEDDFLI